VDDIPAYPGQVEAAFVLTTVGNATLESIDATEALVSYIGFFRALIFADFKSQLKHELSYQRI